MQIFFTLIFALMVRLISINQSLWLDEATTALVSKMPLSDIFTKLLPADFHPPLYYLLMKGWVGVFGSSEISLRIPSVIFGAATIYFIYLIAKKLFGEKTANIASVLSATSGLLIYYSQEARMYALVALLVSILFYLFIEKKWLLFSIILPLLAMTDYVALLILPVFLVFAGKGIKKAIVSLLPMALVFALWLPIFLKQLSGGVDVVGTNWGKILGTLSLKNLALIPVKFVLGRINFDNDILYVFIAGVSILIYLAALSSSILRGAFKKNSFKLVWSWLTIPIIFGTFISIKIPVLNYFRFLFCLPALYILFAKGISGLSEKKSLLLFGTVLILNMFFSGKYLFDNRFHRENWRDMSLITGSDKIIFPANSQKEALTYYNKGENIVYYKDFSGGERQIWLSRYVWNIFDPNDSARAKIESLGYNKVQELNLNGVEFWQYIKQ